MRNGRIPGDGGLLGESRAIGRRGDAFDHPGRPKFAGQAEQRTSDIRVAKLARAAVRGAEAGAVGQAVEVYDYDAFGWVDVYRADTVSCDADSDADCDLMDFGEFQVCFDATPVCEWADIDTSGSVDLADFATLSPGGVEGSSVYGTSRRWSGCVRRRLS